MIASAWNFVVSLLPWSATFDVSALVFVVAYMVAQVFFCISLRRLAMLIPGPERMCNPLWLWILVVPGVGAVASFSVLRGVWDAATAAIRVHHVDPPRGVARGFAITYGLSRLLILVPGMLIPALLLQSFSATGFLLRLTAVAKSLRTQSVAVT
jgi:hypothetical protein